MRERILNFLAESGTLIAPEAMEYLLSKGEPIQFVQGVLNNIDCTPLILTVEHLQSVEKLAKKAASEGEKQKKTEAKPKLKPIAVDESIKPITHFESVEKKLEGFAELPVVTKKQKALIPVHELPGDIKILRDITGNSTCEGTIGDFKLYFNDRLKTLRKILKEKRQMVGVRELSKVKKADGTIKIIGMVSDIRTTKNGHKMIILEDENDSQNVLLTKDSGLASDSTVVDEVIGIIGSKTRDGQLLLAQELVRPDVTVNRNPNRSEEDIYVAFVADIHAGSKTFLKEEFENFLEWLKGNSGTMRDVAKKVGYLVVPGDTVDGIGIYPDQEEELAIDDIYGQYEELARLLSQVPEHIKVIMQPGNHDAVRPAEPQPTFPQEIRDLFPQNVIFTGNPCYFSLHGVEILAYHGRSMDDFIKALPSLDYGQAIKIMINMLKKRHLVPIYGGRTPIAPEHKDYLVIDRIPDIFVTGHGHSTGLKKYRGITLINASCWQSQTNYQKMHNFVPDPGKIPIFNLHTGEVSIMDFS
ncbi:MAG: DNA-directed DNA polymerase II small subunit [Thermoplasmata archaeon]|nr:MAG: DNA-directed DNA polymerase II small subunit [Thermoplasmata archaeon]